MPKLCGKCHRIATKGRITVLRDGQPVQIKLCSQHRAEYLTGKNEYQHPRHDSTPPGKPTDERS